MAGALQAAKVRESAPAEATAGIAWPSPTPKLSPGRRLAGIRALSRLLDCAAGSFDPPHVTNWADTIALADELLVTPALWPIVERFPAHVPEFVQGKLRNAQGANTIRNLRLRSQLTDSVAALNRRAMVPLLLKGARQLVDGSLPRLGDRWLTDLDLAVPFEQFDAAREALAAIGYVELPDQFEHPHELPLSRPRDCGPLELHAEIGSPPLPGVLPLTEVWRESVPFAVGLGQARGLSLPNGVIHNVLHASVQDLNHAVGGLPLRQLVTLSGMLRAADEPLCWRAVAERFANHGLGGVLRDYVWLAHRFAALPLPSGAEISVTSWRRARAYEFRVLAGFALGWPPEVHRNLRFAFAPTYLDSLYGHGRHPIGAARNRAQHAVTLLRRDGRRVLGVALRLRV